VTCYPAITRRVFVVLRPNSITLFS